MALTKAPEELLDKSLTSALTITTADNNAQLILVNTDADANIAPLMQFYRNSSSPADNDQTGRIEFNARNDNSQDVNYATVVTQIVDASDGEEDGRFAINTMVAGTSQSRIDIRASETIINNESIDVDFRVESDGNTHALFLDSGGSKLGINTSSPEHDLHVVTTGTSNEDGIIKIGGTNANLGFELMYDQSGSTTSTININPAYSGGVLETKISGNVVQKMDNLGHVTMPLQPAFQATTSVAVENIGTNGAENTVKFGNQVFDQNGDFNDSTFTFTAPVAGKYQLQVGLFLGNVDSAATYIRTSINTSNRNYHYIEDPNFSADKERHMHTVVALGDMDANDTAHVTLGQYEGTAQMDATATTESVFSGYLVA